MIVRARITDGVNIIEPLQASESGPCAPAWPGELLMERRAAIRSDRLAPAPRPRGNIEQGESMNGPGRAPGSQAPATGSCSSILYVDSLLPEVVGRNLSHSTSSWPTVRVR